ncbi:MAG: hypothetical protein ACN6OP_08105 [Pseudomonadales bacterium]
MKLETARLMRGSETPAGDGVSGAMRCVLSLSDGSIRGAILKRMERQRVLAEAFSALLLRGWGLSVPDPYLVDEGDVISFASADATYPSLKQRLGIAGMPEGPALNAVVQVAMGIVSQLAQTPTALMADEAIDNRDRNLGNILWDGQDVAWIDHELALGLAQHQQDVNKLAAMVGATQQATSIKTSALAAWMAVNRDTPTAASQHCAGTEAFASLVASRLNGLGTRILARFPAPQDLLSGA